MHARVLPVTSGIRWLAQGWQFFKTNPRALLSPLAWYIFAVLLTGMIPFHVGEIFALAFTFLLRVVTYRLCRDMDLRPGTQHDWRIDKLDLPPLLRLTAIAAGFVLVIALIAAGLFKLLGWAPQDKAITDMTVQEVMRIQLTGLALGLPLTMALWFSPVLVGVAKVPPLKAMFFSLVACWRNLRCFLLFTVSVFMLFIAIGLIGGALGSVLGAFSIVLVAPALFALMAVLLGAAYVSTKDVFGDLPSNDAA